MMFPLDVPSPPSQESNATNLFFQIRPVTRFFEQIKIFVPIGLYSIYGLFYFERNAEKRSKREYSMSKKIVAENRNCNSQIEYFEWFSTMKSLNKLL